MTDQDFRPLLPKQRLAAGKAQLEMEVDAVIHRVATGDATAEDARFLQQAFNTLRGSNPC